MSENKVAARTLNTKAPKNVEQRLNKGAYKAPRLVVIGTAVELVQGYIGGRWDGGRGYWQS